MTPPRRDKPTPGLMWPMPGVRTWVAPELYLGGDCTGTAVCETADRCNVGVTLTLESGLCGCECPCHEPRRERARRARAQERHETPWWLR